MAVTREGLDWLWRDLPARLAPATLRVSDGTQTAEAQQARAPEYLGVLQGNVSEPGETEEENVTLVRVSLLAEFGPNEANFEWTHTEIVLNGVVIDASDVDLGRKAQGSSATLETFFDAAVD